MYPQTEREVILEAHRLYETWVSNDRQFDLSKVKSSIRLEMQANREMPARATKANKQETLRDLRVTSYIQRRYSWL